jgi:transposase
MEVLHACCCGLDVHKKGVTACVLWAEGKGKKRKEKRQFGTMTRDLLALADWLRACGVTHVAMESTGVYWKPVWNVLEGQFEILLVNAQHIKAVPGRKTDQNDAEWIADLLQHGLLRRSFVPPTAIRELRDLTRYRVSLVQECNRLANRIQKVLEDANIKLASVATDALGASGRAMLKAMIEGEGDAKKLAEMSRGLLRNKIPELQGALEGRMKSHHRFLLKELMEHLEFVESKIARLEQEIGEHLRPFEEEMEQLGTIPGVDWVTASGLIAEIGVNMNQFGDPEHLGELGGSMSRQLRERRQAEERENPERKCLAATMPVSGGMGRVHQEEQLSLGAVPALGGSAWNQARHLGRCTQTSANRFLHLARWEMLPRARRRLL